MKNVFKLIGFIAFVAIMSFTFASCGDADGGGTVTSRRAAYTSEDAEGNRYELTIIGKASGSVYTPQNGDPFTLDIKYKNGPTRTSKGTLANTAPSGGPGRSKLSLKVSDTTFDVDTCNVTDEVSVMTEIDGNIPVTSSTDNNTDTIIIFRKTLTPVVENAGSAVIGVILNKVEIVLGVNREETIIHTVIPTNAANKNVSWSSNNAAVATVENGVVRGVSAGSATIRVTTEDGSKAAICNVTVTASNQTPVRDDYNITPLYDSDDSLYGISITPKPGKSTGAVTIWYQGTNYPKSQSFPSAIGEYTVSFDVAAADGWNAASGISVGKLVIEPGDQTVHVTNVTLNKNTLSLAVGGTETLIATVAPSNATNKSVTWSSSNTAVATVSATGLVRGVSAGSATIRVTTVDGNKTDTCTVTVTAVSTGNMIWTAVADSKFGTNRINAIAYGNGKFVAGGQSDSDSGCLIAYSSDGTTWTAVVNSTFNEYSGIHAITYGSNKFVAGGDSGKMAYSSDGVTWTAVANSRLGIVYSITYGNGKFVAGGKLLTGVVGMATSSDGVTWTAVANTLFGTSDDYISAITYGNGKFVAGVNSGKMFTSPDGVTWTAVTDSKLNYISTIAYGDGKFVAGGEQGKISTSSDGVTWTAVEFSTFGTSYINAIDYGKDKFVAVGTGGKIAYSSDGTTWTAVADSTFGNYVTSYIEAIAYGNGKFVAGGWRGRMAYSDDGSGSVVQNLSGNITISPSINVTTGMELTATYSGNETVSYQWKNGTSNVGTNSNKHTPATAGSYTVTVSAAGYNSKTSAAVTVTAASAGGTFTMTGIPSQYNGKYVIIETDYFMDDHGFTIGGAQSINTITETVTGALISNGSVSVPMWQISPALVVTGYTGNHTISLAAGIMNTTTDPSSSNILAVRFFYTVAFSNGSATRAWSAGVDGNTVPVTGVTLNKTTLSLAVGGSETLTATVAPADATNKNVSWKSSTDGIATVTQNGLVTAVAAGSAIITVTTEDGNKTATCNVTVTSGSGGGDMTWTRGKDIFPYSLGINMVTICFGDGKFVVGGGKGKMAYSSDGNTWTEVANSAFDDNYYIKAIAYGNGKFVAVGGTEDDYKLSKIAYSSDGINWTAVTKSPFTAYVHAVAYGNNKFIAGDGNGNVANSSDGITWSALTGKALGSSEIFVITWCNDRFIAGGWNGAMAYSTNGTNWNNIVGSTFSSYSSQIRTITYGIDGSSSDKYVAGGSSGHMAYSSDSRNWTAVEKSPFLSIGDVFAISYGNGMFVAGGSDFMKVAYSSDGITWTSETNNATPSTIYAIAYGNGKFVAIGGACRVAYTNGN